MAISLLRAATMVRVLVLLCVLHMGLVCCNAGNKSSIRCLENERHALLELKEGFENISGRFASWVGNDCCSWEGIRCDMLTNHVVSLNLSSHDDECGYYINIRSAKASLKPSFASLVHLQVLDLSCNNFTNSPFPHFLGSFHDLRYLYLPFCGFSGPLPQQFGKLLQYIDLSGNNISDTDGSWLHKFSQVHSLRVLKLSECDLSYLPQTLPNSSFTHLSVLDLSQNNFSSIIPAWLYRITSLQHLDLSCCDFNGTISRDIGALSSLEYLDIGGSPNLHGSIPTEIGNLSKLFMLDLSETSISMAVAPNGPGNCCNLRTLRAVNLYSDPVFKELGGIWSQCRTNSLEVLCLYSSGFFGNLPDWLWGLENLKHVNLRRNFISGSIPAGIGNVTSLQTLDISNNQLNGSIDKAIGYLSKLENLYLSDNKMRGDLTGLPDWFWKFSVNLDTVSLRNNNIHGRIRTSVSSINYNMARDDSSSNSIHDVARIPTLQITYLDLSNNSFSGPLPVDFDVIMPNLTYLLLSMNKLTGSIPDSLCDLKKLKLLDLSKNGLSGEIPSCSNKTSNLAVINVEDNYISGEVPCSSWFSNMSEYINLNNNKIYGKIPCCIQKCTSLGLLNIGNNRLTGSIPACLADGLSSLKILSLPSNLLTGIIPPQLSFLGDLHILDLSGNNLSGEIPLSLENLTGMKFNQRDNDYVAQVCPTCESLPAILPLFYSNNGTYFFYAASSSEYSASTVDLHLKGNYLHYDWGRGEYLASMDLSCNNLSGEVPIELMDLIGLESLNLSGNQLQGKIPSNIGKMIHLETLDLSRNQLGGSIPDSLSNLSSLSTLNLSYNLLSGKIPTGPQLQILTDPSIYMGNLNLCGPPLNNPCEPQGVNPPIPNYGTDQSQGDSIWNLGSMGFGFAFGLLGFCGFIFYQNKWSDLYVQFLDKLFCKFFFRYFI